MDIFNGLEQIVEQNYPLSKCTWFGLGGNADYFAKPRSIDELKDIVKRCHENNLAIKVLGSGSNLLITDKGIKAVVIKLDAEEFSKVTFDGQTVTAGAGADLAKLVLQCTKKGLSGIEGLCGIPGSIGGSVRMNAGGRFGDLGQVVESVTLLDYNANTFVKSKPELVFDYRSVNITAPFILDATLKMYEADPEQILKTVQEVWIYKKNNQPLNTRNSGCIFKNPPGQAAGALIDRAGLKDVENGGAVVSDKHANFIIAKDGCTSNDVKNLIEHIQKCIQDKFDITLELEIEIWN
jgi:UDP-N-acetylmuramate dehydrogenase